MPGFVCIAQSTEYIFTTECGCVAGYSTSCKHVFALLHFIEEKVKVGHNKTCTDKKQQWNVPKKQ